MATSLKISVGINQRKTKHVNSKNFRDQVAQSYCDAINDYQVAQGPDWFVKSKVDEMYFTSGKNLQPLVEFTENFVIDPLLQKGDITRGVVKLAEYNKKSKTDVVFSVSLTYRQKNCINDTVLVLDTFCSYT